MGYTYTDAVFKIEEFTVANEDRAEPLIFTATDKAVLNALAHHAHNDTGECFPGYGRLSDFTLYSRSTVVRAIHRLKDFEFIAVTTNTGRGSNNYKLDLGKLLAASLIPTASPARKHGKKLSRKAQKQKNPTSFDIEADEEE